jgi:hypothetical protein
MNDLNTFMTGIRTPMTPHSAHSGGSSSPNKPGITSSTSSASEPAPLGEQLLMQLQLLAFSEHGIGSELEEL